MSGRTKTRTSFPGDAVEVGLELKGARAQDRVRLFEWDELARGRRLRWRRRTRPGAKRDHAGLAHLMRRADMGRDRVVVRLVAVAADHSRRPLIARTRRKDRGKRVVSAQAEVRQAVERTVRKIGNRQRTDDRDPGRRG